MISKRYFAIVSNLRFISRRNFMLSWVKHEKSFITSVPGFFMLNRNLWTTCQTDERLPYTSELFTHMLPVDQECLHYPWSPKKFSMILQRSLSALSVIFIGLIWYLSDSRSPNDLSLSQNEPLTNFQWVPRSLQDLYRSPWKLTKMVYLIAQRAYNDLPNIYTETTFVKIWEIIERSDQFWIAQWSHNNLFVCQRSCIKRYLWEFANSERTDTLSGEATLSK